MASIGSLPERALFMICHGLSPNNLVNLGQVCRALRAVARDARAWERASLSVSDTKKDFRILLIAPALRSLQLWFHGEGDDNAWPSIVDLTRGPRQVKKFSMDWDEHMNGGYSAQRLIDTLRHYQGHLEVVNLGSVQSTAVLECIDGLGIKDLHIHSSIVRCYCGQHSVKKLALDNDVSAEVAAELLKANKRTLTQFNLETISYQDAAWFFDLSNTVPRAIEQCKKIEKLRTVLWGKVAFLKKLSNLKYLTLLEIDSVKHSAFVKMFSYPVAANLTYLKLHLESRAHRGILQAVARGCTQLQMFAFTFEYTGAVCQRCYEYVTVPRDLHAVLGPLARLQHLKISCGRIPSMVFKGWEDGAMPGLKKIEFDDCRATQKGLDALQSLKQARADVGFPGKIKKFQGTNKTGNGFGGGSSSRCSQSPCDEPSDCDDEDEPESRGPSPSGGNVSPNSSSYSDRLQTMMDVWSRGDDYSDEEVSEDGDEEMT